MLAINQEELFKNVEILPLELKTKLVDMLLISINPLNESVDNAWIKEVNRRKKELDTGDVTAISGNEVFRKIQESPNLNPKCNFSI
jgi:hypothetical protein